MGSRTVRILAIVLLVLGAAAFYQLAVVASRGGETAPLYSTRRYDPYGTAALRHLLAERLVDVRVLQRPRLKPEDRGVLIQILPRASAETTAPPMEADPYRLQTQALLDWIAEGNTLIQLSREQTALMDALGVTYADDDPHFAEVARGVEEDQLRGLPPDELLGTMVSAAWADGADHTWQSLPPLTLRSPRTFAADAESEDHWRPLATHLRRPVAGEIRHGEGRAIFVGAPTPALNHALGDAGNLHFLLAVAGEGPVILDDWSHGLGHAGTIIDTIRQLGLLPLLGQIALVILVWRWSTRGRLPLEEPAPARRRSSREQIETLGHLYAHALTPTDRVRRVHDEVLLRFATGLRCRPRQVEARLAARTDEPATMSQRVLAELRAMAQRHAPACLACGYNLTRTAGERCPECDAPIPRSVQRHIEQTLDAKPGDEAQRRWSDRDLARLLTVSHRLMKDLTRG